MRQKLILTTLLLLSFAVHSHAQYKVFTFTEAEKNGKSFQHLDSLYKSALHSDPKLAVFRSENEQANLQKAYAKMIHDLAVFLKANNFKWGKETKCFNRIYFSPKGRIDYFLYTFPGGQLSPQKEKEFVRYLKLFVSHYQFALTASEKFAQCSPIKYADL